MGENCSMFLHEKDNWTDFYWNSDEVATLLDEVSRAQGRLYGRLDGLGFENQLKATAENLLVDIVGSSGIENISLDVDEVRSSIARKVGVENMGRDVAPSHYVDSIVNVMLDAMVHYDRPHNRSGKIPHRRGVRNLGNVWAREDTLHRPVAQSGGRGDAAVH